MDNVVFYLQYLLIFFYPPFFWGFLAVMRRRIQDSLTPLPLPPPGPPVCDRTQLAISSLKQTSLSFLHLFLTLSAGEEREQDRSSKHAQASRCHSENPIETEGSEHCNH